MSNVSAVLSNDEVVEYLEGGDKMGMRVSVVDRDTLMISSASTIATVKWRPDWSNTPAQFSVRKVSVAKDGTPRDRYLVVAGPERAADADPAETLTRYPEPVKVIAGFDEEFPAYELIYNINNAIEQSAKRRGDEPDWAESTTYSRVVRKVVDIGGTLGWIAVGIVAACVLVFGATLAKRYGDLYVQQSHGHIFSGVSALKS